MGLNPFWKFFPFWVFRFSTKKLIRLPVGSLCRLLWPWKDQSKLNTGSKSRERVLYIFPIILSMGFMLPRSHYYFFLMPHLSTFISFNVIAGFDYIPSSICRQDSNPRPLGWKPSPLTTRLWLLVYFFIFISFLLPSFFEIFLKRVQFYHPFFLP